MITALAARWLPTVVFAAAAGSGAALRPRRTGARRVLCGDVRGSYRHDVAVRACRRGVGPGSGVRVRGAVVRAGLSAVLHGVYPDQGG